MVERPLGPCGLAQVSAFDILCHVRDATRAYAARLRWTIFNDDPSPDYDENNCVAASRGRPVDVREILDHMSDAPGASSQTFAVLSDGTKGCAMRACTTSASASTARA